MYEVPMYEVPMYEVPMYEVPMYEVPTYTVEFGHPEAGLPEVVGGKGANLGLLTAAGFGVPPGFTVTVSAYTDFLEAGGLRDPLSALAGAFRYDRPQELERQAEQARRLILDTPVPASVVDAVEAAYRALNGGPRVAVRSSGTAEDLAEASFAGLHDTYLDVRRDDLVDAVHRCWASLWTARAVAYRNAGGFDHLTTGIAVVVQEMVEAEVAGVLFTADPVSTATDEMLVNASWGLGEAVVSGLVTPDTFVLRARDNTVRERILGTKELRVQRAAASGTVTEPVPAPDRERYCLTDHQLDHLAELGKRVQRHYGGFPQDIEWALRGGELYLLQSRAITGVEFSWDAELDAGCTCAHDGADAVWTRAFADTGSTKAISPLMYSARFVCNYSNQVYTNIARTYDLTEVASTRAFKFHKAELYYNVDWERALVTTIGPPQLRPALLSWMPPALHEEVLATPFSYADYGRRLLGAVLRDRRKLGTGPLTRLEHWRTHRLTETAGLTPERLRTLSDTALERYTERQLALENEWVDDCMIGFIISFRDAMATLAHLVGKWYTGGNPNVFGELISGAEQQSDTQRENLLLWELAKRIRRSPTLTLAFETYADGRFFAELEHSPDGREFLADYRAFLDQFGHRGAEERDIIWPRRSEDPSLDYQALRTLLKADDTVDPAATEEKVNARRRESYREVLANLRSAPFGAVKAEVFAYVYDLVHRYVVARDNERCNPMERMVFSVKRGYLEIGRRLHERGQLDDPHEFFFLGREELYGLLHTGAPATPLLRAKIAGRRRDWERFAAGEYRPPMYLRHRRPVDLDAPSSGAEEDGVLHGLPMNRGEVTATARVVPRLSEVGRINPGEILVAHSTDPGWTPAFLLLSGLVIETGGLLSHGSCLAREYGFPAVQLAGAVSSIPDGATVTISGDRGTVTILEETS
jgi:pyruvate,water dikinase